MRRTALSIALSGVAAIALAPAAASAHPDHGHYPAGYQGAYQGGYPQGGYPQGGYIYDCDDSTGENALVGGLLGAVIGGAVGAASNDDDRYRGHYGRGYHAGYGYPGHGRYRHHDDDGDDVVAGALIGGVLGAAVGAATGEKRCDYVYRGGRDARYYGGAGHYDGGYELAPQRVYQGPDYRGGYVEQRDYVYEDYDSEVYVSQSQSFDGARNYADVLRERGEYYSGAPEARLLGAD